MYKAKVRVDYYITRKTTAGFPMKEMAVDNLRLLPPEYVPAQRFL